MLKSVSKFFQNKKQERFNMKKGSYLREIRQMHIAHKLEYGKGDLNSISRCFAQIMADDKRVECLKCNPNDLKWIQTLRTKWGVDNAAKRLGGAEIMPSPSIAKGEVIIEG